MKSSVQIRRTREQDLLPAFRMVMKSFNHLRKKHSMKPVKVQLAELPPVQKHLVRHRRRPVLVRLERE